MRASFNASCASLSASWVSFDVSPVLSSSLRKRWTLCYCLIQNNAEKVISGNIGVLSNLSSQSKKIVDKCEIPPNVTIERKVQNEELFNNVFRNDDYYDGESASDESHHSESCDSYSDSKIISTINSDSEGKTSILEFYKFSILTYLMNSKMKKTLAKI